jgi:hypothetical protein
MIYNISALPRGGELALDLGEQARGLEGLELDEVVQVLEQCDGRVIDGLRGKLETVEGSSASRSGASAHNSLRAPRGARAWSGYALVDRGERNLDAGRIQAQGIGWRDRREKGVAEIVPTLVVDDQPPILVHHEVMV